MKKERRRLGERKRAKRKQDNAEQYAAKESTPSSSSNDGESRAGQRQHSGSDHLAVSDDSDYDGEHEDEKALAAGKVLPAWKTKHLSTLSYPCLLPNAHSSYLRLHNLPPTHCFDYPDGESSSLPLPLTLYQSSVTGSTSSSIWLSAQVLACYLLSLAFPVERSPKKLKPPNKPTTAPLSSPVVIELGAGTGLLSLILAANGWTSIPTDLPWIVDDASTTLRSNISTFASQHRRGLVQVRSLDWCDPLGVDSLLSTVLENKKVEIIVAADTLYVPHLLLPFFTTLSVLLRRLEPTPRCLVALERRDPAFIDEAIRLASTTTTTTTTTTTDGDHHSHRGGGYGLGLKMERLGEEVVAECVREGLQWKERDWDGVEIWEVYMT